ncbi:MAG: phage tail assembly protein [Methylomonas sp.]
MSVTVPLSKPITVGDAEITELDLREPTIDEVVDIGYPYLMVVGDGETKMELRPKVIVKYVVKLAAVPPSSIKKLSLADLGKLNMAVMGFFGDEAEEPQT